MFFAFLLSKILLIEKQFSSHSKISQDILTPILTYVKQLMDKLNINDIPVHKIIKFYEHGFEILLICCYLL